MTVEFFADAEKAGDDIHNVLENNGFVPAVDPENPSGQGLTYTHPETGSWAYVFDGFAYGELEGMRSHEMKAVQDELSSFGRDALYSGELEEEPVEDVQIIERDFTSLGPR